MTKNATVKSKSLENKAVYVFTVMCNNKSSIVCKLDIYFMIIPI